jgi:magnesium transporter
VTSSKRDFYGLASCFNWAATFVNVQPGNLDRVASALSYAKLEMRSLHLSSVSAPSSSLLRFLRAQTEYVCFFTSNHPSCPGRSCGQRPKKHSSRVSFNSRSRPRCISTIPRHKETLQSTLFDLGSIHCGTETDQAWCRRPAPLIGPSELGCSKPEGFGRFRRFASSDTRPLLSRIWGPKHTHAESAVNSSDLPPLPSFLGDSGGTTVGRTVGKAPNELKLRCTEFDEQGNVTLVSGEFKKSELIAKASDSDIVYS